jgi:hypothetical protein
MDFSCRGELRAQGTSRAGSPDVGVAHVVPDHRHRLVTRHPHDGAVRGAPTGGAAPKLYDAEITGLAEAAKRASGRAIPAAKAANEILRALTASRAPARVLVGTGAKITALLRSWLDKTRVVGLALGLERLG